MRMSTEMVVKKCLAIISVACEDMANGNIFSGEGGKALFESVTREYGVSKRRHFDPVGIGEYLEKEILKAFGANNDSLA